MIPDMSENRECSIDGCTSLAKRRGWCDVHYIRWYRLGDPVAMRRGPAAEVTDEPACSIEGCRRRLMARGWCATHYARWQSTGDPLGMKPKTGRKKKYFVCSVEGCDELPKRQGMCGSHAWRQEKYGDPLGVDPRKIPKTCTIDGCDGEFWAKGLCNLHYSRLREHGDPGEAGRRRTRSGEGGYRQGYHVVAGRKTHRVIMEEILSRPLRAFENVHHKNGIRSDNSPENLELWTKAQPCGQRPQDLVGWVVEHYRGEVEAELARTL